MTPSPVARPEFGRHCTFFLVKGYQEMEQIKETNDTLFKMYSKDKNNIEIRNKIVLNNLNLVPYTINTFNLFINGIHDYEEMLQDGYIALIKAVESFDNSLGYQFSSYAIKCILTLTRNRLDYNKDISLNVPINESAEGEIELIETIKDENIDIEKEAINKRFFSEIRNQLSSNLDHVELSVINGFYGINEKEKSIKELAESLNLSEQQVKNIKFNALQKIRRTKYFRMLYLDIKPVSYYPTFDFKRISSGNNFNNTSPVEKIVFEKGKQEKQLLKKTLKHIKSTF